MSKKNNIKEVILSHKKATRQLAEEIAALIDARSVILLYGPLGSGKTFFTTALCKCLGVTEMVNSPSYVLINRYSAPRFPVYHIDLYRLNSREEAMQLGIEEFCEEGLVVIEWPQLMESLFLEDAQREKDRRIITIHFDFDGKTRKAKILVCGV